VGRRVTFTNNFAVEGHYFNFSTSGQWLWDSPTVDFSYSERIPRFSFMAVARWSNAATWSNTIVLSKAWECALDFLFIRVGQNAVSIYPPLMIQQRANR
jgi:hypothetical protein